MTKKLFYENSYMTMFEATVLECQQNEKGYCIVLDQTAFYPEGGGQSSDKGTLGGLPVKHVFLKEGIIYHVTDESLKVGDKVEGEIDFTRRFDYMQQHSGEHIVSGLIKSLYGFNNVGFHLSEHYMTADFDGELTVSDVNKIETLANEGINKNIQIKCEVYPKQDIENVEYRSKIELPGEVRLVTIEGYDNCACCGTHVKTTLEVGLIKIIVAEKHRGGTRLTILCGLRALNDYTEKHETVMELMGMLSSKKETIVESVERVQQEVADLKQKLADRTKELFHLKAKEYVSKIKTHTCILEEGLIGDEVRRLCQAVTEVSDFICLVVTGENNQFRYALGSAKEDVRPLCQALNKAFNGKGGGKADLCQGSLNGKIEEIEKFINNYSKMQDLK